MKLTKAHRAYWRRNMWLTASLLTVWFLATFLAGYYAAELNTISFLGFPLGFYFFAQGAPIMYLIIIGIHALAMSYLDRRYGVGERR